MRLQMAIFALVGLSACSKTGYSFAVPPAEEEDDIDFTGPGQPTLLGCDNCVHTAPATFTGPSNFWRGGFGDQPDCSGPTPFKGIEGFLLQPSSLVQFVRECRVTPSDTCETEGKVCVPFPDADFETCIHHVGEVDCPREYGTRQEGILVDDAEPWVFTLCCMAAPVPG